jgi:hypothetical protein
MSDDVVENWIRYHEEERTPSDPLFAAWAEVDDLVRHDPEAAWLLTLQLVAAAPSDRVLAAVAAGPLEDLLNRSGDRVIDRVELHARSNPKFRRCLTGAWGIPASARERLSKYTSTVTDPL